MVIDLLYFKDCPGWKDALDNLKAAVKLEGFQAEIRLIPVEDDETAEHLHFPGSPSFRLDGQELWPEPRQRYDLSCRVYPTPDGLRSSPSIEMLREKLRKRPG